jgi:hypothetical protein
LDGQALACSLEPETGSDLFQPFREAPAQILRFFETGVRWIAAFSCAGRQTPYTVRQWRFDRHTKKLDE